MDSFDILFAEIVANEAKARRMLNRFICAPTPRQQDIADAAREFHGANIFDPVVKEKVFTFVEVHFIWGAADNDPARAARMWMEIYIRFTAPHADECGNDVEWFSEGITLLACAVGWEGDPASNNRLHGRAA